MIPGPCWMADYPIDHTIQEKGEVNMKVVSAENLAANIAENIKKAENTSLVNFFDDLKRRTLFIGTDDQLQTYLQQKGIKIEQRKVMNDDIGGLILNYAKDRNGQLVCAHMLEWELSGERPLVQLRIEGAALDIPTKEFDRLIAEIDNDLSEERECDCPACTLRRLFNLE